MSNAMEGRLVHHCTKLPDTTCKKHEQLNRPRLRYVKANLLPTRRLRARIVSLAVPRKVSTNGLFKRFGTRPLGRRRLSSCSLVVLAVASCTGENPLASHSHRLISSANAILSALA